ncbi:MAG: FIST C-terminal domain-containing protein [Beijerinckiaceae bacterium]|jgi:hypothetical protein|nr:FIST C-terminal domain-containing protein [Beijerinckiaceae bacterium]
MQSRELSWHTSKGWTGTGPEIPGAQLVLTFGSRAWITETGALAALRALYPQAHLVGCSTGGQIVGDDVSDEAGSALALAFGQTHIATARMAVGGKEGSFHAGQKLAEALIRPDLKCIFVLCDGLLTNGSQLVAGLRSIAGDHVVISGGLAGDGAAFERTLVHLDGVNDDGGIVAVGLSGEALRIGHGCAGGWSEFGPRRVITRSVGNVLHRIDGEPILDLYRSYLGEEAEGLPGTGLLYPLQISDPQKPERTLVRTVLAIDEENGAMTFAGDIPEGWNVQLMRGHFDRLVNAAADAATHAVAKLDADQSSMAAILISCVGRRILMGEGIVGEVEAARKALGPQTPIAGFYSYGEISPHAVSGCSELHNQTMTVTTFSEAV